MLNLNPAPPTGAASAFSSGLPSFLLGPGGVVNSIGIPSSLPNLSSIGSSPISQQEIFVLALTDVAANVGSMSPVSAGWQFFAGQPTIPGQLVVGRVRQGAQGWRLIALGYDVPVNAQYLTMLELANLSVVQNTPYELRILEVPGVNLRVFWLASQQAGSPDYVFPYPQGSTQTIPALKSANPFTIPAFLTVIRPYAALNLAMPAGAGA